MLVMACWAIYAVLYTMSIVVANDSQVFWDILIGQLIDSATLLSLTLPAWWLIFRELENASWWIRIVLHVLYASLYGWVGIELLLFFTKNFVSDPSVFTTIETAYPFIIGTNITLYSVHFAVLHAIRLISRLRYQRQRATELLALARESELAALKAQINPHFLFNTLNSISALAGSDPGATRRMISRLADMLRYALDSSKRDLVSLREEVAFTEAYLDIEKQRMPDRLSVEWKIDERALDELLPPIVIQPLVENAIKHGIAPRESGGTVCITAKIDNDMIELMVKDNGIGSSLNWDEESTNGIGLTNTRSRLENMYGELVSFQARPVAPNGFSSSFKVPV